MNNTFNISFCTDENFVQHTAVAISSIINNASDPRRIQIFVIDAGLSPISKIMLRSMCQNYRVDIHFLEASLNDDTSLCAYNPFNHHSRATYGRLLLPDLLDSSVKTCLHVDSDLVVLDDIFKLKQTSFDKHLIFAVDDFHVIRTHELSIPSSFNYFNAGVLLLDLAAWRKDDIAKHIMTSARKNIEIFKYRDQDALNALLYDRRGHLPLRWNQQIGLDYLICLPDGSKKHEMKEAMINPAIVHFSGPRKPWHYLCSHPYAHLYEKYLSRTPWASRALPAPESLTDFIRGRMVIVFGAGRLGRMVINKYRKYGCQPTYVLDNDPNKAGMMCEDLPVHTSQKVHGENPEKNIIVIASMYQIEIADQLKKIGLAENRHFVKHGQEHKL